MTKVLLILNITTLLILIYSIHLSYQVKSIHSGFYKSPSSPFVSGSLPLSNGGWNKCDWR